MLGAGSVAEQTTGRGVIDRVKTGQPAVWTNQTSILLPNTPEPQSPVTPNDPKVTFTGAHGARLSRRTGISRLEPLGSTRMEEAGEASESSRSAARIR